MSRKCYHSITPEQCEEDLLIHPSEKSGRQKEEQKINYNNTLVATMYSNKRPFLVYESVKNALILFKENT